MGLHMHDVSIGWLDLEVENGAGQRSFVLSRESQGKCDPASFITSSEFSVKLRFRSVSTSAYVLLSIPPYWHTYYNREQL